MGLTSKRFEAFWNLADSSELQKDKYGKKIEGRTGERVTVLKLIGNVENLSVESISKIQDDEYWHVLGWINEPINTLIEKEAVPDYLYVDEKLKSDHKTFTEVTIKGFHILGEEEFRHEVLKDYILWFTKFGSIEINLGIDVHKEKRLVLQGLGREKPELIKFGHVFPSMANNVKKLKDKYKDSWEKNYVNKWAFNSVEIKGYPDSKLDMLFYIEGDSAKRRHNDMLKAPGRPPYHWRYTVMDRYGIYVCKDYIPCPQQNVSMTGLVLVETNGLCTMLL